MSRIKIPTNKNFGLVFFIVFLLISLYPLINSESIRLWSLTISIIFLILGLFNSRILFPLNKIWFNLGIFLGRFVSPFVMMVIYFCVVTPIGLLMRLIKKDILNLNYSKKKTYWIKSSNVKTDMRNQF